MERMVFLNHAAVAPLSAPAAEAIHDYAEQAATQAYVNSQWYQRARRVKQLAARLINAAGEHEIAFVANTTSGLAQVANGLKLGPGDRVVISSVEYPANRYPWENLARTRGVELYEVPQRPDGRIDVEDVLDAVTDHTRVVALSHVQYASGYRIDLRPIADLLHQAGGLLCVDAIQSAGAMQIDVQRDGIDFLAADGHKWMLGPEGCGIFYCRADLAHRLEPNVVGWMCMEDALDFDHYRFALLPDARRFEPGSYNIPGILALGASLELLLEVGLQPIWHRIEELTAHAERRLIEKGYRIFSPRQHEHERSGILSFTPPDDSIDPHRILAGLQQNQIEIALRAGRLRVSPHFYNTLEQIDRFADALP